MLQGMPGLTEDTTPAGTDESAVDAKSAEDVLAELAREYSK